jgi:hypothetical protein
MHCERTICSTRLPHLTATFLSSTLPIAAIIERQWINFLDVAVAMDPQAAGLSGGGGHLDL